jgi:hypothetical protein
MVAPIFYRAGLVCSNVWIVAALCWSWLESAEPLRKVTSSVWIKLDDHTVDVGIICKCVLPAQLYYLQACAAWPTVLFASVCCLTHCIISKCVLPDQLYYLQVCAAWPTVLFASVWCLTNCIICKCVLPDQLYYLQVGAAYTTLLFANVCCLPTVLFASVCCLPNCIICKCVLPAHCIICKCVLPARRYYLAVGWS